MRPGEPCQARPRHHAWPVPGVVELRRSGATQIEALITSSPPSHGLPSITDQVSVIPIWIAPSSLVTRTNRAPAALGLPSIDTAVPLLVLPPGAASWRSRSIGDGLSDVAGAAVSAWPSPRAAEVPMTAVTSTTAGNKAAHRPIALLVAMWTSALGQMCADGHNPWSEVQWAHSVRSAPARPSLVSNAASSGRVGRARPEADAVFLLHEPAGRHRHFRHQDPHQPETE